MTTKESRPRERGHRSEQGKPVFTRLKNGNIEVRGDIDAYVFARVLRKRAAARQSDKGGSVAERRARQIWFPTRTRIAIRSLLSMMPSKLTS